MPPSSIRSRNLAQALIAAALGLGLGHSPAGLAQDAQDQQEADAASGTSTATAADQPRSRRERRRSAESAVESQDPQAQGAAAPATAAAAAPAVETVEDKLVCKTIKQAGTKIGKRVCGTPEQWAARGRRTSDEAQDAIQEIRDRSAFPAAPEVPVALP